MTEEDWFESRSLDTLVDFLRGEKGWHKGERHKSRAA